MRSTAMEIETGLLRWLPCERRSRSVFSSDFFFRSVRISPLTLFATDHDIEKYAADVYN